MSWLEWAGWDGISGIVSLLALALAIAAGVDLLLRWRSRPKFRGRFTIAPDASPVNGRLKVAVTVAATGPHTWYEVGFFTDDESQTLELPTFIPMMSASDQPIGILISVPYPITDKSYLGMHYTDMARVRRKERIVRQFLNKDARFERWHPFWYEHWYGVRQGYWKETRTKAVSSFPK